MDRAFIGPEFLRLCFSMSCQDKRGVRGTVLRDNASRGQDSDRPAVSVWSEVQPEILLRPEVSRHRLHNIATGLVDGVKWELCIRIP